MGILTQIIARNPPSILVALGGLGWLAGISGSGWLLFPGIGLQVLWLAKR